MSSPNKAISNGTDKHAEAGSEKEKKGLLDEKGDGLVQRAGKGDAAYEKELEAKEVKYKGLEDTGPIDKWNIVYFILILHGIGTLMPWNMFITANAYFENYKLAGNNTEAVVYRKYFLSFLGFTAQIPNVILNLLNLCCQVGGGGNSVKRITWSIITICIMFVATIGLAMVDSSDWPGTFFWITMVTVVIINMANGVYQNSVYGVAACLPMKYTNAVILGSNISGTLTSILSIISIASTPDPRTSAIYYFLAAIFILLAAFDTYFILPLMPFYRHYSDKAESDQQANESENSRPPFWYIFKQGYKHFLSVFFVFFVTLTCFPAIQAGVAKSSNAFFIPDKFYTPVTCFLFFNAFAMFGNLCTEFIKIPGPRWTWIPVVLRVLFIPFFMFCNSRPETRGLPVLIGNDYAYIAGGIIMAFTSGYFSSTCMMYAPSEVEPRYQPIAGMMGAFFLITGIFAGVLFSLPVTLFIDIQF